MCALTFLPVPQDSSEPLRARTKSAEFDENEGSSLGVGAGVGACTPINIVVEVRGKRLQGGADKTKQDANLPVKAGRDVVRVGDGYGQVIRIRNIEVEVVAGEEVGVYRFVDTRSAQLDGVTGDIGYPDPAISRIGDQFSFGAITNERLFAWQRCCQCLYRSFHDVKFSFSTGLSTLKAG